MIDEIYNKYQEAAMKSLNYGKKDFGMDRLKEIQRAIKKFTGKWPYVNYKKLTTKKLTGTIGSLCDILWGLLRERGLLSQPKKRSMASHHPRHERCAAGHHSFVRVKRGRNKGEIKRPVDDSILSKGPEVYLQSPVCKYCGPVHPAGAQS